MQQKDNPSLIRAAGGRAAASQLDIASLVDPIIRYFIGIFKKCMISDV